MCILVDVLWDFMWCSSGNHQAKSGFMLTKRDVQAFISSIGARHDGLPTIILLTNEFNKDFNRRMNCNFKSQLIVLNTKECCILF